MPTTIMRDSIVGDDWIRQMMQYNPVQRVIDQATGQPNGNILTGPVRLAFCDSLFEAKPQMRSDPTSKLKHMTTLLFPPNADLSILTEEYYACGHRDFPSFYNREQNRFFGLGEMTTDQAEKSKYAGFTPGCQSMTVSSNFKPQIVDAHGNPIIDPNQVYAGVWAIVAINCYASGKQAPKKGPRFGLQQIMIVGNDTKLSGGAPDPSKTFAQTKVHAPAAVPGAAFGQSQGNAAPPPPPPPPGMGGHTGTYYGSTGHAPPPPPPPPAPGYDAAAAAEEAELRRMMGG